MENVCLRRCSCRCFLKKEVPEEALLRLFQAAMQAPSARNEQPWEFILIRDPLVKEQIAQINPYYRPADGADCLLLLLRHFFLQKAPAGTQMCIRDRGYPRQPMSQATEEQKNYIREELTKMGMI